MRKNRRRTARNYAQLKAAEVHHRCITRQLETRGLTLRILSGRQSTRAFARRVIQRVRTVLMLWAVRQERVERGRAVRIGHALDKRLGNRAKCSGVSRETTPLRLGQLRRAGG